MYEFSGISGRCRPFHELGWPTQDQLSIPVLLSHVCPSPRPDDGRLKPHKDEQPPVEARPTASTHCGAPHSYLGPCWAPVTEARAPSKDVSLPGALSIHKYHICQRAGARCLPQIGCPGG